MIDRSELRTLYQQACHGAGAPARTLARQTIELMLLRDGTAMREAFEDAGLCIHTYFASRPISDGNS